MCIRDSDFAPLRNPVGKALDALIEIVRVPENDAYRAVYDLSLIHISEPTRPY